MSEDNRQIVLAQLPQGRLGPEHFALAHADRPAPGEGEVLLRVLYVSLDAANRAWMHG
ncbi:MAG TPA: NADP-dependent oxidoreductase, partial [Caulobacteraceae bacterium]